MLRRSGHLSTFAHMGAVFLFHDLYGYIMEMSPDVLGQLDDPATAPTQHVEVFKAHACLIDDREDEREALWAMVAVKGKWNVWRRHPDGGRVTIWTAWGESEIAQLALDETDTRIWDDIDGERRLATLREVHGDRVMELVNRLTHSNVQALKLCGFPMSTFAKRPAMAPAYLSSTMPYKRWTPADGEPWGTMGTDIAPTAYYQHDVTDADAQFDHQETTLSHLFRRPHPALGGATYGARIVDALAARGPLPTRILEIGGGLGFFAAAVLDALAERDVTPEYTIVELSPALAAAQKERLAGRGVSWIESDVLAAEPEGTFDWILANEMVGDLPAIEMTHAQLDDARARVAELGVNLDDAPDPFYLMTGAFELVRRIARWLAPGGTAMVTEFGDTTRWPRLSSHLDHPELSTHFGQLHQAARGLGLDATVEFVIDLLDLDRTQQGLATTRSHFRALRAMLADAGVTIEKVGYTPDLLRAALGDRVALADIGEIRWDRIEDRLMGLVPHEFRALIAQRA